MPDRRALSSSRAAAIAVTLLAITLDALQPLAHAAAMRADPAARSFWSALCQVDVDESQERPTAKNHQCCLGLPHVWAKAEPDAAFTPLPHVVVTDRLAGRQRRPSAAGIRDGPNQPRAPPFLA